MITYIIANVTLFSSGLLKACTVDCVKLASQIAISDIPYQGDFPLNSPRVGQVIIALDGLIGLVELPDDASVGEQDDRTWDQGA